MERALVETGPEGRFGPEPQLADLEFAELVAARLARPRDIPIDLGGDVELAQRRVPPHEVDGLLTRPAERVDAGVDDETARAPHLIGEPAEVVVRRLVQTHLHAKPLAVQRPALAKRGHPHVAAKLRNVLEFLRDGALMMMTRNRLVERQRDHLVLGPLLQVIGVRVEPTGLAVAEVAAAVVRGRGRRRRVTRHGPHAVGQPREVTEERRHPRVDSLADVAVAREQLLGSVVVEARIGPQVLDEPTEEFVVVERRGVRVQLHEIARVNDLDHLASDAIDLVQAEFVDLLSGHVRRGHDLQAEVIERLAVGPVDRGQALAAPRNVLVDHEVAERGEGIVDERADLLFELRGQLLVYRLAHREAGLQTGLVIQEVNRKPVSSVAEFRSAMGAVEEGEAVMLLVHVRGGSRFIVIEP